jgi:hypothetical protein
MKISAIIALALFTVTPLVAEEPIVEPQLETPKNLEEHHDGSTKLAKRQDELSADVQQLALEQTTEKVITLLKECEDIMGEATDNLSTYDTGGETIAAQTEVIEKIHEAAKEKLKGQGKGKGKGKGKDKGEGEDKGSAMMDMLERMMGITPDGDKPGGKNGKQSGGKGGNGQTGDSNSPNSAFGGAGDAKLEARRIPKAAGVAGKTLPEEFRSALDAYNRGAEKLSK